VEKLPLVLMAGREGCKFFSWRLKNLGISYLLLVTTCWLLAAGHWLDQQQEAGGQEQVAEFDEWMVRRKQLEQETRALREDAETLIIILTQAQIHYS
jgi:hypothetical protein